MLQVGDSGALQVPIACSYIQIKKLTAIMRRLQTPPAENSKENEPKPAALRQERSNTTNYVTTCLERRAHARPAFPILRGQREVESQS